MSKKKPDLLTGRPAPHESAVVRIEFEDHGQDFLWWDLTDDGVVLDCGPFQGDVWCGNVVLQNPASLKKGSLVTVASASVGRSITIKYPLEAVQRLKETA